MSTLLSFYVQPGAKHESLQYLSDGSWKLHLRIRPIEGKANKALCYQIADWLHVPKSAITIERGEKSRKKIVKVACLEEEEVIFRFKKIIALS